MFSAPRYLNRLSKISHSRMTPCKLPIHRSLATMAATAESGGPNDGESQLPKLTAHEFKQYNRMAEHMDYFHNNFRQTWTLLHTAAKNNKRPNGMSLKSFLDTGLQFCHHLTVHHGIEERHIFPLLARRMPAFRKELELLEHHRKIHAGLDVLEAYLTRCKSGEEELRLQELGRIMDGFGGVLWEHLDAEVKELGAENMRKYWSLEEMRRMPM